MKIISITKSTAVEGNLPEARGTLTQVHDEPVKGFFRRARLTGNALILERGDKAVGLPLAEVWKLAELHEPAMVPPKLVIPAAK